MSGVLDIASSTAKGAAMGSVVPGIGTLIGGGIGLATGVVGLINSSKAKKTAEELARTRPLYPISPLAGEDLSLATSDLANMGNSATKAYDDLNNQQFSASLGAILKSGGGVNSIGDIYGNNQDGRLRLQQMKDNLRLNQIQNYVRANNAMQQEQQTQWQVNKDAVWKDAAQANAAARQGAQQQISQGLNTAGSAAMYYGQGVGEANKLKLPKYGETNNTNAPQFTGTMGYVPSTGLPAIDDASIQAQGGTLDMLHNKWING
jgi:hypothetical protein